MKAYQAEATGTFAPTIIGVGTLRKNLGSDYFIVALVHAIVIASTASALLFNKSNVVPCPPPLGESVIWFRDLVLEIIMAFFLVSGRRTTLFLTNQARDCTNWSTAWRKIERVRLRPTFV